MNLASDARVTPTASVRSAGRSRGGGCLQAAALLNEDPRRCEWRIQNRGTVLHAWGVIDEQRPRARAVTISPDQHRGPQRSELEAIQDANANIPQRDNYADDPNVLERFGDERDAAVEAAAWRPELLAEALDEPAAAAFPARLHDAVVDYQRRGWHLFPTGGRDMKRPAAGIKWGSAATNDLTGLLEWFDAAEDSVGVGVACGPSGLVVVDVDSYKAEAEESMRWLTENGFDLPPTLTAETASGGKHFYYQASASQALGNTAAGLPGVERKLPGIDFRADGGYVVAPPTRRGDGGEYRFTNEQEPAACPDWLTPAQRSPAQRSSRAERHLTPPKDNTVALKRLAGLAKHLAETPEGERHAALYTIARTLGQLVDSGHLTRDQIHAQLYDAAQRNGSAAEDGDRNITQTINDGIEKGISDGPDPEHSEPGDGISYTLPPKGFTNGAPGRLCSRCEEPAEYLWRAPTGGEVLCDTCREKHTKRAGLVLRAMSTIRPEEVEWYFEGRVPLGSLTLLVGPAGLGKTTFACELSARGTRGQLDSPAAAVIFATAEDSLAHTLVPRLIAAGADPDRIHFVSIRGDDGLETGLTLPEDTDELQNAVKKTGANLIILDPVVGHLSGNIDSHKDHSVRRALAPLARLAEDTGAAILGIGHLNKSSSTDVLTRVGGSVAFGAAARSVLLLGEDHEAVEGSPERLLIHAKSNLGPLSLAHRLKVEARTITTEGREIATSRVAWLGEELTATASKVAMVGGLTLVVAMGAAPAAAHDPDDDAYLWTCLDGDGEADDEGDCYRHHSNGNADWAFDTGGYSAVVELAIIFGFGRWDRTHGHEFNYIKRSDGNSGSMIVYWEAANACGNSGNLACFDPTTSGQTHISDSASFFDFDSRFDWYTGSGSTPAGDVDLRGIATHEAGHGIGLGHAESNRQTMRPGVAVLDEAARTIEYYDKKGRCQIYGHSHFWWGGCSSYGGSS